MSEQCPKLKTETRDPAWLRPIHPLSSISLQLTSRCDLRCSYCTQGTDLAECNTEMSSELFRGVREFASKHCVPSVNLGFFGETIARRDWTQRVRELMDAGLTLHTNSNFARVLSDEEIDLLSQYGTVMISIDCMDVALQRDLRPKLDVRTVLYNSLRLRARAMATRRNPVITWTAVLSDKSVGNVKELLWAAAASGINRLNFNDLIQFDGLNSQLRSIFDLPDAECVRAIEQFKEAVELSKELGIDTGLTTGMPHLEYYYTQAQRRLKEGTVQRPEAVSCQVIQGRARFHTLPFEPGKTRACLQPWTTTTVAATGNVYACCFNGAVLGTIGKDGSLDDVLNQPAYRQLRDSLLTGENLNEACRNCPLASLTTPEDMQQKVKRATSADTAAKDGDSRRRTSGILRWPGRFGSRIQRLFSRLVGR
jgi:radical SAM protein with 4Fe4S-binding SPASM domain